jgi:hypothetical protein
MIADVNATVATSQTTAMSELTPAHPLLLDMIVFRHTFYLKFSRNHIQTHISLNITQIYYNMTITEFHTPIYIWQ